MYQIFPIKKTLLRRVGRSIDKVVSRRNSRKLTLIVTIMAIIVTNVFTPLQALAITKTKELSTLEQAQSFGYYQALKHCMAVGWFKNSTFVASYPVSIANKNSDMSATDAVAGNWFNAQTVATSAPPVGNVYPAFVPGQNSATVGVINEPEDGDINCAESQWIKNAALLWGYPDLPTLLCDIGFTRQVSPNSCATVVPGATNNFQLKDFNFAQINSDIIDAFWTGQLKSSSTGFDSIKFAHYSMYFNSFENQCGVPDNNGEYDIQVFEPDSTVSESVKYGVIDRDRGSGYDVRIYQDVNKTCGQLAELLAKGADAVVDYATYLVANDGIDSATVAQFCIDGVDSSGNPCTSTAATSCAIDGIGWIICPAINFLASLADGAFGFLADSFLRTDLKIFDTSNPTYGAWVIMRNIANVAFVIAFLIIIFSQLTSVGITNYGVKKMLPRLVIAAILVNISYFVCQIAVDLSNVLGYSLKDLLEGLGAAATGTDATASSAQAASLPTFTNTAPGTQGAAGFEGLTIGILAGGVGLALYPILGTLIPVLLAAVISLIMILFILVARQALIILLIIISPLAFVAYLLPNTEDWFKKWQKALIAMLLLFPIVALVFGISSIASDILSKTFNGGFADDTNNWFGQIIAAAVMILPLFIVPGLLKKALDGVGSIGTKLNGFATKAGGGLGKAYSGSKFNEHRGKLKAEANAYTRAGQYTGKNPFRKIRSAANSKLLNNNKAFNFVTGGYGNRKGGEADKFENEKVQGMANDYATPTSPSGAAISHNELYAWKRGEYAKQWDDASVRHGGDLKKIRLDPAVRKARNEYRAARVATVRDQGAAAVVIFATHGEEPSSAAGAGGATTDPAAPGGRTYTAPPA